LEDAIKAANADFLVVDVPTRKIDEGVVHYDIEYVTEAQAERNICSTNYGSPSKAMQEQERVSLSTPLLVTFGECLMTIMWFMLWLLVGCLHSTFLENHYIEFQDWIGRT
jgi:hypothetical protein